MMWLNLSLVYSKKKWAKSTQGSAKSYLFTSPPLHIFFFVASVVYYKRRWMKKVLMKNAWIRIRSFSARLEAKSLSFCHPRKLWHVFYAKHVVVQLVGFLLLSSKISRARSVFNLKIVTLDITRLVLAWCLYFLPKRNRCWKSKHAPGYTQKFVEERGCENDFLQISRDSHGKVIFCRSVFSMLPFQA